MEQIRIKFRALRKVSEVLSVLVRGCKALCLAVAVVVAVNVIGLAFRYASVKGASGKALDPTIPDLSFLGSDIKTASIALPEVEEVEEKIVESEDTVVIAQEVFFKDSMAGIDVAVVKDEVKVEIEPVVTFTVASAVYNSNTISYTDEDLYVLEKIVQAEAGNCDMIGKILVANVIINRVNSPKFPNNIKDVVFAHNQFSPIADGAYYRCVVSDETREAVRRALDGEDYSQGATFFAMTSIADTCWAGRNLRHLFEHDGHTFFAP